MDDKIIADFLSRIRHLRSKIKTIYLFGSRARGDFRPDSDYDLLLVVDKKEKKMIDALYDKVMDTLLSTGRLISLKIFKKEDFNRLSSIPTIFMEKVLKEGIKIG